MSFQSCCIDYIFMKKFYLETGFLSTWRVLLVYLPGLLSNWGKSLVAKQDLKIKNALLRLTRSCLGKINDSVERFDRYMIDVRSISILTWYVPKDLQIFASVAFSKCFGAFIVITVEITLEILKKESFKFSLKTSFK